MRLAKYNGNNQLIEVIHFDSVESEEAFIAMLAERGGGFTIDEVYAALNRNSPSNLWYIVEPSGEMYFKKHPWAVVELVPLAEAKIASALKDKIALDDGNVLDLLCDNIAGATLPQLRQALAACAYGSMFPRAANRSTP